MRNQTAFSQAKSHFFSTGVSDDGRPSVRHDAPPTAQIVHAERVNSDTPVPEGKLQQEEPWLVGIIRDELGVERHFPSAPDFQAQVFELRLIDDERCGHQERRFFKKKTLAGFQVEASV